MRLIKKSLPLVAILALAAWVAPAAWAQSNGLAGTYNTKVSANGKTGAATLSIEQVNGTWEVSRTVTWSDGTSETLHGTAAPSRGGWLRVTFPVGPGIVENLDLNGPRDVARPISGTYRFYGKGKVWGRLTNPDAVGGWRSAVDSGAKDVPTDLGIVYPKDGSKFLIGQIVAVKTNPAGARWDVSGAATRTADGRLQFTGPGEATLTATLGDGAARPVKVKAIGLEVVEISVEKAQPITDAPAPQFARKLGQPVPTRKEPAAILIHEALQLRVTVQGSDDLSEAAKVKLVGTVDGKRIEGDAEIQSLAGGQEVLVRTPGALNTKVAVNPLVIFWNVECEGKAVEAGPTTPLRVYTSYKPAVSNVGRGTVNTKVHFEFACTWANGASQNIGQGADSIAYQIDNQMRHYVHPVDFKKEVEVPAYAKGSQPPVNYRDLPGDWSVRSSGERGVTSLYYPPLEPKKPYEEYTNFRGNFGWNLLDNPTHTGGRCNQQASLVCDIVGTLGIKATVHYLERTGRGKRTGRPVRNYFYAAGGSGPWNFHGIVRATMANGSEWLYDGSFSSPPRRLNGERSWAEAPGGPFIQKWGPWYYEDFGGQVPADDIPTKWDGIQ